MTVSADLDRLTKEIEKAIASEARDLYANLQVASPVDTGTFRSAWTIKHVGSMSWEIHNPMQYASILWDGRRQVGNKMLGSEQWPHGGAPMLVETNRKIEAVTSQLRA